MAGGLLDTHAAAPWIEEDYADDFWEQDTGEAQNLDRWPYRDAQWEFCEGENVMIFCWADSLSILVNTVKLWFRIYMNERKKKLVFRCAMFK